MNSEPQCFNVSNDGEMVFCEDISIGRDNINKDVLGKKMSYKELKVISVTRFLGFCGVKMNQNDAKLLKMASDQTFCSK